MPPLDAFLAPVPGPSPSGIDLRNDARFHAIERLLLPATRAERLRAPESDPAVDWSEVLRQCEALAAEGRDLRLLAVVARGLAAGEGFDGAAAGLALLADTVESYWDSVHPELRDRPSPREAAVRRINALHQIENEEDGLLGDLALSTAFSLRGLGRFTGGDLAAVGQSRLSFQTEMPQGLGEAERAEALARHEARAGRVRTGVRALSAEQPDRLAALAAGVAACREALSRLEESLSARVAENGGVERFEALGRFLERVAAALAQPGAEAAPGAAPEGEAAEAGEGAPGVPGSPPVAAAAGGAMGPIASRRDVERALDQIIDFYERTEPASPIPLLARRLRKLVPMTFLQLMEELAPAGMKEVKSLAGATDDKGKP